MGEMNQAVELNRCIERDVIINPVTHYLREKKYNDRNTGKQTQVFNFFVQTESLILISYFG